MKFNSLIATMVLAFSVTAWAIPPPIIEIQKRQRIVLGPVAEETTEEYVKRESPMLGSVAREVTESYSKQ